MDTIRKQVRSARRRLLVQRFLSYLPWTLLAAGIVANIGIAVPKMVYLAVDSQSWAIGWAVGAVSLALFVNIVLTWIGRPTLADAAIEIDRRFGLRERLSSAMLLGAEERETSLGRALAEDAERRAEAIDVRDHFSWGFQKRLMLPLLPALLAAGMVYLPDQAPQQQIAQADPQATTRIKRSIKPLLEAVKKKRELAEKNGLNQAADLFRKLEGDLAKLQKDTKLDTKQTLSKLTSIKEQLENRKKELGDADALKKSLQNLKKLENGPADKLAEAIKQADVEKAKDALEEILEKIRQGNMSKEDQEKLTKQLKQLQQAMTEAAEAHEQAKQQMREQIEKARQAGDMQKAAQLEKQLAEKQAQDASIAQMQQMAQALSKASQAMKEGKMGQAQQEMEALAAQLDQMIQADQELDDFDEVLDSLSASKASMLCGKCDGEGCSSCMGMSMMTSMKDYANGRGTGAGARSEEEDDVDFFDSRVRDRMGRGETVYGGKVGGANKKGVSLVEVQEAVLAEMTEEPEPLEDTPLPKAQREHTRDFFNLLREGAR